MTYGNGLFPKREEPKREAGKAREVRECASCAAWDPLKPVSEGTRAQVSGRCRRVPPSSSAHWPITGPTEWCLEFCAQKELPE